MTTVAIQNDEAKKAIKDALIDASGSMTRIEAERDLIKAIIEDLNEKYDLDKKVVRRMIKVYHKQNFDAEVEEQDTFQELYETVLKGKK